MAGDLIPNPFRSARDTLRARIAGQVRGIVAEENRRPAPAAGGPGFYPPGSVIRAVHGDVTAMMIGGTAALLLQMLHPLALAGVLGHSNFRSDMQGRLRRTARFIAVTTYGSREAAETAIARVVSLHARVSGTTEAGEPYSALDPHLLAWVHLAEATGFLSAYKRYIRPQTPQASRDSYFAQAALVARKLGAHPVPESEAEASALMRDYRPELRADEATHELASLVLRPVWPAPGPATSLLAQAAVDLLPGWAMEMLHLRRRTVSVLPVRLATFAGAATVRWALRRPDPR